MWMLSVGSLRPNGFGLFDMKGNIVSGSRIVCETDLEWRGARKKGRLSYSRFLELRGGAFRNFAVDVRLALRSNIQPAFDFFASGFRAVSTYPLATRLLTAYFFYALRLATIRRQVEYRRG
jgi:hypothetical protein